MMHEFFEGVEPKKFNIFISGQKFFAAEILRICLKAGYNVVGVCCPIGDKYIGHLASINNIKIIPAGSLNYETMPENVDLGITAHSHDYIGKLTRYKTKLGWIGYHPSLLPRHRGRSSIEWAIKFKDFITGGTVFWLNHGIDRGDIERQEFVWIDPKYFNMNSSEAASKLWRDELLPLGVKLVKDALNDIQSGKINKIKQNHKYSTFEPSTNVKDIFKPDLLLLKQANI